MRERRMRLALALAAVALVAVAAIFAAGMSSNRSTAPAVAAQSSDGELPAALSAHLAKLSQAIPGKGGEYAESESAEAGSSAAGLQDFIELRVSEEGRPTLQHQGRPQGDCRG
jgi:ABC-type phosphate transport system substrate-binding protein